MPKLAGIASGHRSCSFDGKLVTYTLEGREPRSLITVGQCGDDAAFVSAKLYTKISTEGFCVLDDKMLTDLIHALTQFRDQIHDASVREAQAKLDEQQQITDHDYLSAGDNPRASGDTAYRGCSRTINGSICGRSRKEHAK